MFLLEMTWSLCFSPVKNSLIVVNFLRLKCISPDCCYYLYNYYRSNWKHKTKETKLARVIRKTCMLAFGSQLTVSLSHPGVCSITFTPPLATQHRKHRRVQFAAASANFWSNSEGREFCQGRHRWTHMKTAGPGLSWQRRLQPRTEPNARLLQLRSDVLSV